MASNSKEYMRKWRENHPGYFKNKQKEYYHAMSNKDKNHRHDKEKIIQANSLSHAFNRSKRWSEKEDIKLINMYNNGVTAYKMSKTLGRSIYSIRSRIYYLKRILPFK